MQYIVPSELRAIAEIADVLNSYLGKIEVLVSDAKVVDSNGDVLGVIDIAEHGEYAFIPVKQSAE